MAVAPIGSIPVHHHPPHFGDLDPSGSFGDPALPSVSIVLLGDSTNTGPGLNSPEEIWVRQVVDRLTDRFHVELTSVSKGGAKVGHVLRTQVRLVEGGAWDVAIVSVGANDALRGTPRRVMLKRLGHAVDRLLEVTGTVVLSGVGDLGTFPRAPAGVDRLLRRRGRTTDRVHRDVAAARPRVFKVSMWQRTAVQFRTRDDIWAADGFHPNAAGHRLWADAAYSTVLAAVESEVRKRIET